MSANSGQSVLSRALLAAVLVLTLLGAACDDDTPPEPTPTPTPAPTQTPQPLGVLDDLNFRITLDGELIAREEVRARYVDDLLVVASTLTWVRPGGPVEERSVTLSPLLQPTHYTLQRRVRGVPSSWVAQRDGDTMDCLANNMAWFGPVLSRDVSPAPGLMMERTPSALPVVLLALQFSDRRTVDQLAEPIRTQVLDVTEDLPTTRALTLSVAQDQGNAVIGTLALEARVPGAANDLFTLWMRPDSRLLFSAEFEGYAFGFWEQWLDPALGRPGLVRIERVSGSPAAEAAPAPTPAGEPIGFEGGSGTLSGTLYRPAGDGPAPALLVRHEWDQPDVAVTAAAAAARGWAVLVLEPAGIGASEGAYDRAPGAASAEDLRRVALALSAMPGIDSARIVIVGVGRSAFDAALALAPDPAQPGIPSPFAGAVLAGFGTDGPLLGELAGDRVLALGAFHGWDAGNRDRYLDRSVRQWATWVGAGTASLSAMGRRVPLEPLAAWAAIDPQAVLGQVTVPVLVVHGALDTWTPVGGAERLVAQLQARGGGPFTLYVQDDAGRDLGRGPGTLWSEPIDAAVWSWLESVPAASG